MNNKLNKKKFSLEDAGITIQLAVATGAIVASLIFHFLCIASLSSLEIIFFENGFIKRAEDNIEQKKPITIEKIEKEDNVALTKVEIAEVFAGENNSEEYTETPQPMPESVFHAKNIGNKFLPGTGTEALAQEGIEFKPSPEEWLPRVKILEIDRDAIDGIDIANIPRVNIPKIERFDNAPDITFTTPKIKVQSAKFMELPNYIPSTKPGAEMSTIVEEYVEGSNVSKPSNVSDNKGVLESGITEEIINEPIRVPEPEIKHEPIEDVLKPQLTVYRPGFFSSDEYIYFRVDVSRKDETSLPVLKRDVLFIQDASKSIGAIRVDIVKKNLKNLVGVLQPTDRFNILAFNDESTRCFQHSDWMPVNDGTKQMADIFIDNMQIKGNTDIYRAIEESLNLTTDPNRVVIVILLTDGSSTSGKVTQDTEIISEFSKMNGGNVSVFSVSPGRKGNNDYLLSMLSYLNRGGAASIVNDRFDMIPDTRDIFVSTSRPILTDVSFVFDTYSAAEVAPHNTPHLYLDSPLFIFGRVKKDVEEITFQAKGKSSGKNYDMVFKLPTKGNDVIEGDSQLRQEWARARMFDLFAEYEKTKSPILEQEMRKLKTQYKVSIPFEERLK